MPRPEGFRLVPWVENLEVPWSLVFLPDGRALVSERPGRIRLIEGGRLKEKPYAELASTAGESGILAALTRFVVGGEGGLMGLAIHPRFPNPPYVYAMHTYEGDGGTGNRVIRLIDEGGRGRFDRVVVDGIPGSSLHNGGRIGFGPDGMLYVATGEIFESERAQDLKSLGGKILRVTADGHVPADNPFPGSPVWSYGHRNPQGLAWHPATGELFVSEHGPSGEYGLSAHDEINVVRRGANYGWPLVVGAPGVAGYVDPLVTWKEPAVPPAGIAFWKGDLYLAALGAGSLIRIGVAREGAGYRVTLIERWFAEGPRPSVLGRLRAARVGPDGLLYFTTSNRDGRGNPRPGDDKIYRLEPR
ncbi:MAG: PQQ-dependent sugar dehydrogenase [Rhodospirillales bacterium]|nr:PQQ-dependent sugar dehydrogenase [Rhodospirillales bacterium]